MGDIIHPIVRAEFLAFTERFEGRVPHMYLCQKGYVTVGLGCKIDQSDNPEDAEPWMPALALPWARGLALCDPDEITSEWNRVKVMKPGLLPKAYLPLTMRMGGPGALRLDDAQIDALAFRRLDAIAEALEARFSIQGKFKERGLEFDLSPSFRDWPADAQLATLSMAWAGGSDFWRKHVKWAAHADVCNWAGCADECKFRAEGDGSLQRRNAENERLFRRAA